MSILVLMADGEVVQAIYVDGREFQNMANYIEEWRRFLDEMIDDPGVPDDYEMPSFVEWLDVIKNVTTSPAEVGVISLVDGYWYT